VRGGDERLWAAGGDRDDRLYVKGEDGTWGTLGHLFGEQQPGQIPEFEALAADTGNGVIVVYGIRWEDLDYGTSLYQEVVQRISIDASGRDSLPWFAPTLLSATPGVLMHQIQLGPAQFEGTLGGPSPGRYAVVSLPDGRIWVSQRGWDGWESYNTQRGTRKTAPKGRARVQRVWREKHTVLARISCTGPTGGYCQGKVNTNVHTHKRSVSFSIPAAPAKVHSRSTARVRLTSAQTGDIAKGRRVIVKALGRTWRIK
jgi:hypothetical protein